MFAGTLFAASGCYAGNEAVPGGPGGPTVDAGHVFGPGDDAGPTGAPSGLPCEVSNVIATYCIGCHNGSASAPSSVRLTSAAELTAPSASDPMYSVAQRSWMRMTDAASPMPPLPAAAVPAADIDAFQAWIAAGYPAGDCAAPTDPYDTPVTCSSGTYYRGGESTAMTPGQACISCHATTGGEAPFYTMAGTVYPTAHEPSDCNGASRAAFAGAEVVITGADGAVVTLTPNSVGNFYSAQYVARPYTAVVRYDGRERAMVAAQMNGDCNVCHTESGAEMAPGRVMLP